MKKLFLFLLLALAFTAGAQEKKYFTPADASYNNRSLYASRPSQLKWVGDQDILMKVDGKRIVTMTPDGKDEATFLSLDELNGYAHDGIDSLRRIPNLTWLNDRQAYFYAMGKDGIVLNCLDIKAKTITTQTSVPQKAEHQTICEATMRIAYTIDNNLYVADGDKQIQITNNPEGVVAGQSVHRNEFAINGGIFWSPDGSQLAY